MTRAEEVGGLKSERGRTSRVAAHWLAGHLGTALGVILLALGAVLTAAGDSATATAAGAVLFGLSGIVISVEAATAAGERRAQREIGLRTSALTRQFGSVTFQVQTAVENVYEGQLPPETALEMIYQCVVSLHGLTKELETVGGSKVIGDITGILRDAQELAETVRGFTAHESDAAEMESIEVKAEELSLKIDSARGKFSREIREEVVDCPDCGRATKTTIGTTPGDSGVGHCSYCGLDFHSHRAGTGGVFSRRPGSGHFLGLGTGVGHRVRRTVDCPTEGCEFRISVPNTGGIVERHCLSCLATVRIDASVPKIVGSSSNEPLEAEMVERQGVSVILRCPDCQQSIRSVGSHEGRVVAACNDCQNVLVYRVPNASSSTEVGTYAEP
ncbi:MAG: hypothetical protein QM648_00680 [Solirubrobacterales bacterium]